MSPDFLYFDHRGVSSVYDLPSVVECGRRFARLQHQLFSDQLLFQLELQ